MKKEVKFNSVCNRSVEIAMGEDLPMTEMTIGNLEDILSVVEFYEDYESVRYKLCTRPGSAPGVVRLFVNGRITHTSNVLHNIENIYIDPRDYNRLFVVWKPEN